MGDAASPRPWEPFASLYLSVGAKASAFLLPLEALRLLSLGHFPAPFSFGHASSFPKQPPLHFTCASGTAVSPLARPFPTLSRPRRQEKGGKNPGLDPTRSEPSPTRI